MTVGPIQFTRVSHGLQSQLVLSSLQRNQLDMLRSQARIATGRNFVTASENPIGAARALNLGQTLVQLERFRGNLTHGDNALTAADSTIREISGLLIEAHSTASKNVGNLTSAEERAAEAEIIAGIRQQLQLIGNRQFDGVYLFGGRATTTAPFVDADGGIAFVGDTGDRHTRVTGDVRQAVNVTGNLLFGALSDSVASGVDLTPVVSGSIRLEDLRGAAGRGIREGVLVFNEPDGVGAFQVDLRGADTLDQVVTRINEAAAAAGSTATASLTTTGLEIAPGGSPLAVTDTGGGAVAADLGIRTPTATGSTIVGEPLLPRVTRLTPLADLAGGSGIDLSGGLTLRNGDHSVTVDVSSAETVQDLLNAINNAGVFVRARINEAGTGIDVFNQVSGSALRIGENGGTTATDLGLRTFDLSTPLTQLNHGRGVTIVEGQDDFRITARNGDTVNVNLDGAQTLEDVIERINEAATAAGVSVSAALATAGNGIVISDATGGTGDLSVVPLHNSAAARDLGLQQTVSDGGTQLDGEDVNPLRTNGILDALLELENALRRDDTQGISMAGARIDVLAKEVTRVHGIVGARAQAMTMKRQEMEDASMTTEVFLSQVQDLDYAEAVTRLQAATTQLQANLQTSSVLLNLSLMDFLR